MADLINVTAAFLVGYAVFMVLIVGLIKMFFPFFTKEQLEHQKKRMGQYKVSLSQVG